MMILIYGGFHKWRYPKMDGLYWKILFKWMIWRSPHGLETSIICCFSPGAHHPHLRLSTWRSAQLGAFAVLLFSTLGSNDCGNEEIMHRFVMFYLFFCWHIVHTFWFCLANATDSTNLALKPLQFGTFAVRSVSHKFVNWFSCAFVCQTEMSGFAFFLPSFLYICCEMLCLALSSVRAYKHWMDILDGYTGWICMDIPPWIYLHEKALS